MDDEFLHRAILVLIEHTFLHEVHTQIHNIGAWMVAGFDTGNLVRSQQPVLKAAREKVKVFGPTNDHCARNPATRDGGTPLRISSRASGCRARGRMAPGKLLILCT